MTKTLKLINYGEPTKSFVVTKRQGSLTYTIGGVHPTETSNENGEGITNGWVQGREGGMYDGSSSHAVLHYTGHTWSRVLVYRLRGTIKYSGRVTARRRRQRRRVIGREPKNVATPAVHMCAHAFT